MCFLFVCCGGPREVEVNEIYGLSNNVLKEWEELEKETGSLEKRPYEHKEHKIDCEKLRKYCEENPFATHTEAVIHEVYKICNEIERFSRRIKYFRLCTKSVICVRTHIQKYGKTLKKVHK